ncbi:MAG: Crp/Fnr family transcriptional regulator [Pseudomonadota bacterium]
MFPRESTLDRCGLEGVAALSRHWNEAVYQANAQIVGADDSDDDVYFVLKGRARAATFTDAGREVRLSDIREGEGFGIFAAIDGRPRSTNVIAIEHSRFARISASNFNTVVDENPQVARALMMYLCERIRELSIRVTEVTTQGAEARLISLLIAEAETRGEQRAPSAKSALRATGPGTPYNLDDDDAIVIDPLPTQQEIANMIFSQRETVGREMSRLARLGLIRREGRRLVIPSLQRLREVRDRR